MFLILPIQAQAGIFNIGVTAKGGTTGLGGDVTVPLVSNWLNLRGGYNIGSLRPSITQAGIKYKADLDFESIPILLDSASVSWQLPDYRRCVLQQERNGFIGYRKC